MTITNKKYDPIYKSTNNHKENKTLAIVRIRDDKETSSVNPATHAWARLHYKGGSPTE